MKAPPQAVVVAGSDPTGGAGLQADLKTFEHFGVAASAVVTAVTVQTATRVSSSEPVDARTVRAQLRAVFRTVSPRVVKCGLLGSAENVRAVASFLGRQRARVVIDPVTRASGGGRRLSPPGVLEEVVVRLFPLADVVTVNLAEAAALARRRVVDEPAMRVAAQAIAALGPRAVVVKGGHLAGNPVDVLFAAGRFHRFPGRRVAAGMHGTGCAFASAVAAGLARGSTLPDAVAAAGTHVRALLAGSMPTRDGGRLRTPLPQGRKSR